VYSPSKVRASTFTTPSPVASGSPGWLSPVLLLVVLPSFGSAVFDPLALFEESPWTSP